jgi:hypothetical protein
MRKKQMLYGLTLVAIGAIIITVLPNSLPEGVRRIILAVTEILAICVGVIIFVYGWLNDEVTKEVKEDENQEQTKQTH